MTFMISSTTAQASFIFHIPSDITKYLQAETNTTENCEQVKQILKLEGIVLNDDEKVLRDILA